MKKVIIWFLFNSLVAYFVKSILLTVLISFLTFPFLFDNFIEQIKKYRNKEIKLEGLLKTGANCVSKNILEFIVIYMGIQCITHSYLLYVSNNGYEVSGVVFEFILGIVLVIGSLQEIRNKINEERFKNKASM